MSAVEKEFLNFMDRFDNSSFEMILNGKSHTIGKGEPSFSVKLNKTPSLSSLLTSTSIALGEGYMNGDIEISGSLYDALSCFLSQIDKFSTNQSKLKKLFFSPATKSGQKKEVSSHYDIGNDFYSLWLDETMSYSCGYFKNETDTLYEAQCNKTDRSIEKLNLRDGMTLCDIGCGWGYLLIEAAKKKDIHAVGITLSTEQKNKFEERIKAEGLKGRVEAVLMDYRDLPKLGKRFDRVVSIGMVEHVGRVNYTEFVRCVKSILVEGGLFLLHFISALSESPGDGWIKKYIFPGGVIPSLREIISICSELNFYTLDAESLRRHYNKTLLLWNENFQKNRGRVVEMFDERFARMWELYLLSCAAAFINGVVDLHQVLFSNGINNEIEMTRWY